MSRLCGLITAAVTPFCNGELDEEGLRYNLRCQLAAGVSGILLLGTTGESSTLSERERERVIEIGAEEVKDRALFIVGTGTPSTAETIRRTRQAAELGADCALVVLPYYNRPSREGLRRHFLAVAECGLPICIYDIPKRTGVELDLKLQLELLREEAIWGIKDCSGDMGRFTRLATALRREEIDASLLVGDDLISLPGIACGAQGWVSVGSNLLPKRFILLARSLFCGEMAAAQILYDALVPLMEFLLLESNPIAIKGAMQRMGLPAGDPRLPLTPLSKEHKQILEKCLETLQEITAGDPKW